MRRVDIVMYNSPLEKLINYLDRVYMEKLTWDKPTHSFNSGQDK